MTRTPKPLLERGLKPRTKPTAGGGHHLEGHLTQTGDFFMPFARRDALADRTSVPLIPTPFHVIITHGPDRCRDSRDDDRPQWVEASASPISV